MARRAIGGVNPSVISEQKPAHGVVAAAGSLCLCALVVEMLFQCCGELRFHHKDTKAQSRRILRRLVTVAA
jgi:hypothetical protein